MLVKTTLIFAALASCLLAIPIQQSPCACANYTIITTRGTGETQGVSIGFQIMNKKILGGATGGSVYHTIYPAGLGQDSEKGSEDIIKKIQGTLQENPSECFILQGYSQGASATCDALPRLTGSAFDAVKGVVLLGNPEHKPNLDCNVDIKGGKSTRKAMGVFGFKDGVPDNWVSKTLDICNFGDGVCDSAHGVGITLQHFAYPFNANMQKMGGKFMKEKLL